jgi:hypothetical protein
VAEPQEILARDLVARHVAPSDHILLVNPPVEETRYNWVRWNQPLDLLKIASYLASHVGCPVSLLDCMQPDKKWNVPVEWLPGARRYHNVGGEVYPMRRFGKPYDVITHYLRSGNRSSVVSQVWITSLCHYWFESVAQACRTAREAMPDAPIAVLGAYPRFALPHARQRCCADYLIPDGENLDDEPSSFDLYGRTRPPFAAVTVTSASAADDIRRSAEKGVLDIALFSEDVLCDASTHFRRLFQACRTLHENLRLHLICGLYPEKVTPEVARILADRKVAEVHFEETDDGTEVQAEAYRQARSYLMEAGLDWPSQKVSGFVWIGRPGEGLETVIGNAFKVLDLLGSLILKPYTPTPGSAAYIAHHDYLKRVPQKNLSPHFFPFAELNGITRHEYNDLYRMAAFLNGKVRNRSFDFLNGTVGSQLLRDSLRREVWKIGPSARRAAD